MVYLGVVLLGWIAWTRLPQELFPPLAYPQLTVVTRYRDAAPEEIEALVTKPIEEVVGTVPGLKRIGSISKEELSLVIAEFQWDTNMDFAGLWVRERLDLIKERLPRGSEDPVVIKFNPFDLPVMVLNLSGDLHPHDLLQMARKQVKNEIEKVEGVAAVNLSGGLEREILVEVDQGRLQASGVPIARVVEALSQANLNYPAGTIKEAFYEYLIRTMGEFSLVKEIPDIAVTLDEKKPTLEEELRKRQEEKRPLQKEKGIRPRQRLVFLKDVAVVKDTFKDRESISRFNGKDNISISIQKQAGANVVQVAERVKEVMRQIQISLPKGVTLSVAYDQSSAIRDSIRGVLDAAWQGGLLAFLVLFLFLGSWAAALNVALVIPIAVLGTIGAMYFSGLSVNVISMGGLALGVGMLVDAGIVVVENIHRLRQANPSLSGIRRAAVLGAEEVNAAIGSSTLTTIVVFLPMVFVVGIAGQLFKQLAYTVTSSLLMSWAVALSLVPVLAVRFGVGMAHGPIGPGIQRASGILRAWIAWFLRHRLLGISLVLIVFAVSLVQLNGLDRQLLPKMDQNQFILKVELSPGTKLEVTDRVVGRIEKVLQAMPEVRDFAVTIGSAKESKEKRAEELLETLGSHQAQIMVTLWPRKRWIGSSPSHKFRTRKAAEIVAELKETLAREPLEGAEIQYILQDSIFQSAFLIGTPIVVEVQGKDWKRLEEMAKQVETELENIPGLYGVKTSLVPPSPELKVHVLKDRAATYHLSVSDIALTAQTALKGYVATKFKEQGNEIDIRVRLRPEDRRDMNTVRRLMVHSPLEEIKVPLAEVAYFVAGRGPTEIRHAEQQRTVLVSARIFRRPLGEVLKDVEAVLKQRIKVPGGYSVRLTGESEQMQESFRSLTFALLLSIILVYMVMASQFESLWQPFLIMATVPMTLIGVTLGLTLTGTALSVMVALGLIVLGGIVVNNGIVLIDFVNRLRMEKGLPLEEALMEASSIRLRPILMTSGTTVLGLIPLALGWQEGVELQSPMAITVMGGLIASTLLTLIFLPTLYATGAEFFERFQRQHAVLPQPVIAQAAMEGGVTMAVPLKASEVTLPENKEVIGPSQMAKEIKPVAIPEIPDDFGSEEVAPPPPTPQEGLPSTTPYDIPLDLPKPEPKGKGPTLREGASAYETQAGKERPPSGIPSQGDLPLNRRQMALLAYLKTHGRITRKQFAELTGASIPTAARDLKDLVDRGLIRGVGPFAKGRYYVLA